MRANLKKARQDAGLTQQQMADKLNIGLRYYQHIEKGDRAGDFNYQTVAEGHCIYPRTKYRKPWDTCKYFRQRNFIEGDFLRKVRIAEEEAR